MDQLDACIPFQEVYAGAAQHRDVYAVVVRVAMIKHDNGLAAGTQHTMDFANSCGCVRRVMEHAVGVNDVERVVREVQCFSISNAKRAWELKQFEATFC